MRAFGEVLILEDASVVPAVMGGLDALASPVRTASTHCHALTQARVTSIDSPERRVLCKSKRHYGINLQELGGWNRKLYFLTYQKMLEGVRYILAAQGF